MREGAGGNNKYLLNMNSKEHTELPSTTENNVNILNSNSNPT